jgi:GntR family transcriptional repressor for pyruvate dehydrogenase complex
MGSQSDPAEAGTGALAGADTSEGKAGIENALRPVTKETLSDRLARRIRNLIRSGDYREGDRLPAIMEMARRFGVGHPAVREALKKLETLGVIEIRHGSGVYVSRSHDVLLMATPEFAGTVTKKVLLDLIETRMPLELHSVRYAARNAGDEHLAEMRRLLSDAGHHLDDDDVLNRVNMAFHRQIASASGNAVLAQLLEVLKELFTEEQRLILGIFGSREQDHHEHLAILEALEQRDEALCEERMRTHLEGVLNAVRRWDPEHHPVG